MGLYSKSFSFTASVIQLPTCFLGRLTAPKPLRVAWIFAIAVLLFPVMLPAGAPMETASHQQSQESRIPSLEGDEEQALRERNHQALLALQKEIAAFIQGAAKADGDPVAEAPEFGAWAAVLYKDALLARLLLEPDLTEPQRYELLQAIEAPPGELRLDLVGREIPSTNPYYPSALRALITASASAESAQLTPAEEISLALRFKDLVNRRKRYSDSYYVTKMRAFLLDNRNSVEDKVDYMLPFMEKGDEALMRYGASYFRDRLRSGALSAVEREAIKRFQEMVRKGGSE